MPYRLGIDLGTTFTAAATFRDGRLNTASLGNRSASIPSVLFLREDGSFLIGDAADRRAVIEPERVAREFKRRLGDSTPIIIGGTPYAAEALMAKLLRWVVDTVAEVEGEAPDHVGITHPANWGPYKIDLLQQAVRLADIGAVTFVTEPEAAAIYYASNERVDPGTVIAAYDLGGGTFDAAVLEKTESGFKILGVPEGIERLGGIDFDHAVFAHVNRALDGALDELDPADENDVAALGRLRHDCVEAKEGLSTDTDVSIPVMLPTMQTQVRLTRSEFEAMVRPTLSETMQALGRALRAADVAPERISKVLLVGGSSRIPLVAQMVSAELGRPVAVDAHPKYAIAHGAALAAEGFERDRTATTPAAHVQPAPITAPVDQVTAQPAEAAPAVEPAPPAPDPPVEPAPPVDPPAAAAPPPTGPPTDPPPATTDPPPATTEPVLASAPAPPMPPPPPPMTPTRRGPQLPVPVVLGAAAVVALLLVLLGFRLLGSDDDNGSESAQTTITEPVGATTTPTTAPVTTLLSGPPPGVQFYASIDSIALNGKMLVVTYRAFGFEPRLSGSNKHLHFFFDTVSPANAGSPGTGPWQIFPTTEGSLGESPFTLLTVDNVPPGARQLCVLVANSNHSVIAKTGNCAPLP